MLSEEMISRLVLEIKRFLLADAMLLSRASDEQLMRRIADVADHKLGKCGWYSVPSGDLGSWMRSWQTTALPK